jgi:hypothetical protein
LKKVVLFSDFCLATFARMPYFDFMKKEDDRIIVHGRRSGQFDPSPENANVLLNTMRQLRGGKGICPRGVYRFKTFEEAHEWMIKMIARSSRASQR